jgi:LL-diaminopimelate aminotransferase
MNFTLSTRLQQLPPYLFIELDRKKKALADRGVDIISFGVGDPDLPTPDHIVRAMQEAVAMPAYHQYPFGRGLATFRQAVAAWFVRRFGVSLNPDTEVHALIGSKEGIGHFPLAFVNPGDVVLATEPGYPVYRSSTVLCGGEYHPLPLRRDNGFLPDFDEIPLDILQRARLLFFNYPNNPTAAVAPVEFFKRVVEFAHRHRIIAAHDCAYSELYYDPAHRPTSFLAVDGAREVGIEFHSLSKTFNMTGWRVGWACGNPQLISALGAIKDNYDSGVFSAVQHAAVAALTGPQECIAANNAVYRERRDTFVAGLRRLGLDALSPEATFYVWTAVPRGSTSIAFAERLLPTGVVCTPGIGMGAAGEGYVRFALTVPVKRIIEALDRIRTVL